MRNHFDFNPGYQWSVECNAWIPGKSPIVAASEERDRAMDRFTELMLEETDQWLKKPRKSRHSTPQKSPNGRSGYVVTAPTQQAVTSESREKA